VCTGFALILRTLS